jgi:hypothetical protein
MWINVDPIIGFEQRPSAPWTLTTRERNVFSHRIKDMQFPTDCAFDGKSKI